MSQQWVRFVGGPRDGEPMSVHKIPPSGVVQTIEVERPAHAAELSTLDAFSMPDVSFSQHTYHLRAVAHTTEHPCVREAGIIRRYHVLVHSDADPDSPATLSAIDLRDPYTTWYRDLWTFEPMERRLEHDHWFAPGYLLYYPPHGANRLAELFWPHPDEVVTLHELQTRGMISREDVDKRCRAYVPACRVIAHWTTQDADPDDPPAFTARCVRPVGHVPAWRHCDPTMGAWNAPAQPEPEPT